MNRIDTKTLVVGELAYIGAPGSWETRYSTAKILKVTPTGQVVVKGHSGERRFNARGEELGCASTWRVPFLVTKERYDEAIGHQKKEAQRKAFERDVRDLQAKLKEGYEPFVAECARLTELAKIHLSGK